MRVIRYSNGSPVRADSATTKDPAYDALCRRNGRRAMALYEAHEAAVARGDTAAVERLTREMREFKYDSADIGAGSTAARAAYLKSLEAAWKAGPAAGMHKVAKEAAR